MMSWTTFWQIAGLEFITMIVLVLGIGVFKK